MNDYQIAHTAILDYLEIVLQGDYKPKKYICEQINEMIIFGKVIEEQNGIKVIKYNDYLFMIKDNIVEYIYKGKS